MMDAADEATLDSQEPLGVIEIDIIIPVHNACETLEEAINSAMHQVIPPHLRDVFHQYKMQINVCCYDDGSTDSSWETLCRLQQQQRQQQQYDQNKHKIQDDKNDHCIIASRLLIEKSHDSIGSRGAGYARNRAAKLTTKHKLQNLKHETCSSNNQQSTECFLCFLDSDDLMDETRIAEQCSALMALPKDLRQRTLLGCKMKRDPPDSTWHYSQWVNTLTEERLYLERFREVTIIQPVWMMCRSRFQELGGYIEGGETNPSLLENTNHNSLSLIHPSFDTPVTLRLAEDLRFFHAHLHANGMLRLHRSTINPELPLVTYRHRVNQSQSFQTSRKLLLHLRALAFESCVLQADNGIIAANHSNKPWCSNNQHNGKFVIWGQGRDGKEFVKALSVESQRRIYCFVDVDDKKIQQGYYVNKQLKLKIPIVHFSLLAKQPELRQQLLKEKTAFGRIDKGKPCQQIADGDTPKQKKLKANHSNVKPVTMATTVVSDIDPSVLPELPVVVCVAMYRTNGALEANVKSIGREEGADLWHFS